MRKMWVTVSYRRIHVLLKRENININHKKVFRLYKECGLKVLKRGGRKRALGTRGGASPATLDLLHNLSYC